MDQRDFDRLVVDDSKGVSAASDAAWLRSPEVVHRWIESLLRQHSTAQAHIASRRARLSQLAGEAGVGKKGKSLPAFYLDRKREYDQSNQNTRRFIGALGDRLDEAKQVSREHGTLDAPSLLMSLIRVQAMLDGSIDAGDDPVEASLGVIEVTLSKIGIKP